MFLSDKLAPHFNFTLFSHSHTHQFALEGFPRFSEKRAGTLFMPWHFPELKNNSRLCLTFHGRRLCSSFSNDSTPELSDAYSHEGSSDSEENKKGKSLSSNEILKKLRRYGISGILSYGLLNTAYYLTTFLFVWFYIAPAPAKMGYGAAVKRFLKVMAMVWAGSQVTKLVRAGGALALAPFVDRGLSWFTHKFKFQTQGKAFMAIVGLCLGLALIVFFVITLLWA
ncbi:hypothetical protein AAZX31_04G117800 [Glycine max]|uniref:Gag-Pol polyprotein/retrotransposon n=3 Tax=Glycine subgen. Soja TaxID=1462606 RepID=K7KJS2_SOYBN|nr:uncharacterized protein LOC100814328 [Glycine max]XP_028228696.1 uncharacterized protein LOC114409433 [Glycine soja]KAG5049056.1 hypothetical protein JHK85_010159 [Glycine max]KAG5066160.1 hypothetical protein JHK86_009891 [Glycine max]KAH1111113.1 hypothetical protein GYH30_009750 [Glycine max]KAH1253752.1 hypothetical protein GmHk_04G010337 [Glycine max]KHN37459.1 hypothetical protein glysoja_044926 [Glycine soja]|eukprot:XP_003522871.1 uncharacterized protein LOC100814328 [Glycine max]